MKIAKIMVISLGLSLGSFAFAANETIGEKAKEGWSDTKKNTKEVYRDAKDEVCEMVNGKLECVGQKVKHGAQKVGDEVKDKTDAE